MRRSNHASILSVLLVAAVLGGVPSPAHAGRLERVCDFLLLRRPSPWLTADEKWIRDAHLALARDPLWRPPTTAYVPGSVAMDADLPVDPRFWYIPGNVLYPLVSRTFPEMVRSEQAKYAQLPDLRQIPPRPDAQSRPAAKATDEDDDSILDDLIVIEALSRPHHRHEDSFTPGGGSSGGGGATGEWDGPSEPASLTTEPAATEAEPAVVDAAPAIETEPEAENTEAVETDDTEPNTDDTDDDDTDDDSGADDTDDSDDSSDDD